LERDAEGQSSQSVTRVSIAVAAKHVVTVTDMRLVAKNK
jgi:hypothetical protein